MKHGEIADSTQANKQGVMSAYAYCASISIRSLENLNRSSAEGNRPSCLFALLLLLSEYELSLFYIKLSTTAECSVILPLQIQNLCYI